MARPATERGSRLDGDVRLLFTAAMAIFVITVVIGILNGLDLVSFTRDQLLTHVHAGTLGWITLAVIGASLWLLSEGGPVSDREAAGAHRLTLAAIATTAVYVLAFWTGNGLFRPLAGTLTLLVILGVWWWAVARARRVALTVPQLGMLAALTTLAIGAILGVLLGLDAAGRIDLPSGIYGAHPSTMVVGYLILAGLAMVEWRLAAPGRPARGDRAGVAQVALPFLAGLALMAGSLFDVFALLVINVPLEVAGVVVFLVRVGRRIRAVRWLQPGPERQFGLAALFLVVNILLIAYVIARYAEDFDTIPAWLLFALDHSMFIGVMTNSLFGLILVAGAERRGIWPWAEDVLFWGVNAGLIGFIVGLLTESSPLKRTFSPILGLSLLLGMLVLTQRLRGGSAVAGSTAGSAPSP